MVLEQNNQPVLHIPIHKSPRMRKYAIISVLFAIRNQNQALQPDDTDKSLLRDHPGIGIGIVLVLLVLRWTLHSISLHWKDAPSSFHFVPWGCCLKQPTHYSDRALCEMQQFHVEFMKWDEEDLDNTLKCHIIYTNHQRCAQTKQQVQFELINWAQKEFLNSAAPNKW